jgi:hypothetical protein
VTPAREDREDHRFGNVGAVVTDQLGVTAFHLWVAVWSASVCPRRAEEAATTWA